jgi:hypothetical protein
MVYKDPGGLGQVHRGLWTDSHIAGFASYIDLFSGPTATL